MGSPHRGALLLVYYTEYLDTQDSARFARRVARRYTPGTLERLLASGPRMVRRGAALALGTVGGYESNAPLGRALSDHDRGVRTLAEDSIRSVWCKAGNASQRQRLTTIVRLNATKRFRSAVTRATELVREAPWFAEAWNQRAAAYYGLHRFAESIGDCREALEINPYHFGAAAGMGHCYLRLGNQASALECFRRALRLNPGLEGVRASIQQLERSLRGQQ
ncbi:MAG: tetratricopeptide repeat protein [Planctomycetia bacterium]|nr:tetratricopeptide repeat protein [Planctomycetia bacterium]